MTLRATVPSGNPASSYDSIQHLRAFAAMSVVVLHVGILERLRLSEDWPRFFAAGVDIFFVISGFVMWHTTVARDIGGLRFMVNRIKRIVPLYWAVTLFSLSVWLISPNLMKSTQFNLSHFLASLSFVPFPAPGSAEALRPFVGVGWTLNYEMFFYLCFAVWLFAKPKLRLVGILVSLSGLVVLHPLFPDVLSLGAFYTSPILTEFLMGVAIAQLIRRQVFLPRGMAIMTLGAGLLALSLTPDLDKSYALRAVFWGLPAAAIVAAAVSLEALGRWPQNRFLHLLGDASYSIYLLHGIVLSAVTTVWFKLGLAGLGATGQVLFFFTATMAAALGGVVVWRFFERPVDRWLRRLPANFSRKSQDASR